MDQIMDQIKFKLERKSNNQGQHLLVDCCWNICTCWFVSIYIWSQKVLRLNDSLLPRRHWRAGRGGAGKEGPVRLFLSSPLAAARVEAWLEGLLLLLALAGPAGDLKNALLRRRLGCLLPTVPDPHRKRKKKKQTWKEVARHPPLSAGPACPAGAAQEEHLLLLRKDTAAGLLLEHMYVLVCICIYLVAECAPTRRLPPTSPSLAGWPGGCGERGTCAAVSIIPLGSCSGGGLAGRTAAAAGFGWTCWRSQECSAPSRNLCNSKPILSSRHLLKLCNKFFFPTSFFLNKFFQSIKALGLQYNWRCMPFC